MKLSEVFHVIRFMTYWREIKIASTKVNTVVIEGQP